MRIVIDMQGAQTESRYRGIGRYALAFAQAVVRNRGEHEVFLALSGLFPDTIEPIRAAFDDLLPQDNIRVWHAPGSVKAEHPDSDARRETAELIREAFLASLQPDMIHITSLFEGYVDDAVTSIGRYDRATPVSVSLYDLIPLLNPDQYLTPNPRYAIYYERKIAALRQAKLLLAISEFSRQEGLLALECSSDQIVNVSTAIGEEFQPKVVTPAESAALLSRIGITRAVVLYTGGADERKNLPRLIEAWSALPATLRQSHQLLFAGRMHEGIVVELHRLAQNHGLRKDELLFSGYVSDRELVQLYSLCKLFVFPSWHEGFGLPALEAMACGAPVIGANTTSLPEVIGLDEALFDPFDVTAIRDKIQTALTEEVFLAALRAHGLVRAKSFCWQVTAQRAIAAWELFLAAAVPEAGARLPACLGRNSLVQAIACHLGNADDNVLISLAACIAQNESAGIKRQLLLDISELCQRDSATGVQRVVRSYLHHLLRNPPRGFRVQPVYATQTDGYRYARAYTARMLGQTPPLIDDAPITWQRGDIFFGLDMQHHVQIAHTGTYARLRQDGVVVKFLVYDLLPIQLADFFKDNNARELHEQWLTMIAAQDEAICISKATADAFEDWIATQHIKTAPGFCTDWVHMGADLDGSQPSRGLPSDAPNTLRVLQSRPTFLVVSTLEPRKAQAQILDAVDQLWARDDDVNLVLVGQQGWKIDALVDRIDTHPENGKRLFWLNGISDEYLDRVYQASTCLVAASINEGFGLPLIEAARHGIPVIARDIPVFREVAGQSAFYFTGETGAQLAAALDEWQQLHRVGKVPPSTGMHWLTWQQSTEQLKLALVGKNYPRRQLLVDISELAQRDARTGIQRVVRSVLKEWLENPPDGFRVELVYATLAQPYRYARNFSGQFTGAPSGALQDDPIDCSPGDIFFALDLQPQVQTAHAGFFQHLRQQGVAVKFLVYDLLCILQPEHFPIGSAEGLSNWLQVVGETDGAVCISQAVADELNDWMGARTWKRLRPFQLAANPLGADVDGSAPTRGLPANAHEVLTTISFRPSFLMVGTLEPRKGHLQVLDAFEHLWDRGKDINLVIVGKHGWMVDHLAERLRSHSEWGKRLFWLEGISDEYLEKVYAASTCLIAASHGEGFGLPLIEAAQHKLPIIARDIHVFREVAGEHAFYFDGTTPDAIASAVETWLELYVSDRHPQSGDMPWLTWKESATRFLSKILIKGETDVLTKFFQITKSSNNSSTAFPLAPSLPLPAGVSEEQLFDFVTSVRVQDAPEAEIRAYGTCDFRRFVYTWGLAREVKGKCLELGGNPYFTTMLLKKFTDLDISLANYFGHNNNGEHVQSVDYRDFNNGEIKSECFTFQHFNVENDKFPYPDGEFNVVIFAEIIEHLLNDPCAVLREIKRVLKPGGTLILTTPNVARLENVARLISGTNIYDPYSGYGPYGRHNREYNRHELDQLLRFEGYEPTVCFTADVHGNNAQAFCDIAKIADLLRYRENDLGQYIFIKAVSRPEALRVQRPGWLYRSYPKGELD